jgi:hypothetical protein
MHHFCPAEELARNISNMTMETEIINAERGIHLCPGEELVSMETISKRCREQTGVCVCAYIYTKMGRNIRSYEKFV